MHVSSVVFTEWAFWLLVVFSLIVPVAILAGLLRTRTVSRWVVLGFGVLLVVIAGVDVYLLQELSASARRTPSLADDAVFVSELSTALYLLPALFGGVGVNIVSHVLIHNLTRAEHTFDRENPRN